MELGKFRIIGRNIPFFGGASAKNNQYIPALHKNEADSFVLSENSGPKTETSNSTEYYLNFLIKRQLWQSYDEKVNICRNAGIEDAYINLKLKNADEEFVSKVIFCCENGIITADAIFVAENIDSKNIGKAVELIMKGVDSYNAKLISEFPDIQYKRVYTLLSEGFNIPQAINISKNAEKYNEEIKKSTSFSSEFKDFINSKDYDVKIKKAADGAYGEDLIKLVASKTIPFETKKALIISGISEQDFLSSLHKLSKSTFKLCMKMPNRYLSDVKNKYTMMSNGQYPEMPENIKKSHQKEVVRFFANHLHELCRLLKYIDTDTLNIMADKRSRLFSLNISGLNELSDENLEILSELIKQKSAITGKALSSKEKFELCRLVRIYKAEDIDISELYSFIQDGKIDVYAVKAGLKERVFKNAGITPEMLENTDKSKLDFNDDYFCLILLAGSQIKKNAKGMLNDLKNMPQSEIDEKIKLLEEMPCDFSVNSTQKEIELKNKLIYLYKNFDKMSEEEFTAQFAAMADFDETSGISELYTVIRESVLGDFNKYITSETNKYGIANAKTKEKFENAGLNYEKWLNAKEFPSKETEINGKKTVLEMWKRDAREDLFLGNKTSCCTAVATGSNAAAAPLFLLHTAFNYITLNDENGNTVVMTRIFPAKVNGENAIIADTLETNKSFFKNMSKSELTEYSNAIFGYVEDFAKTVADKDVPLYFSAYEDSFLPADNCPKIKINPDFIGNVADDNIYINSANTKWINPEKLKNSAYEYYKIF